MDKKNTMLLTVIAVATLLVAVVGATFAYFSVTGTNTSNTSVITATTENVGTVALTQTTAAMHINTIAGDFAQTGGQTNMWATTTAANYVTTEETRAIFTTTVTGGSATAVYKCTFTLGIETTGLPSGTTPRTDDIDEGEFVVYVTGIGTLNLDMSDHNNRTVSKTATVYLTGDADTNTITASAKLVNTAYPQQAYLANKNITVTFSATNWSCDTVSSAGSNGIA